MLVGDYMSDACQITKQGEFTRMKPVATILTIGCLLMLRSPAFAHEASELSFTPMMHMSVPKLPRHVLARTRKDVQACSSRMTVPERTAQRRSALAETYGEQEARWAGIILELAS